MQDFFYRVTADHNWFSVVVFNQGIIVYIKIPASVFSLYKDTASGIASVFQPYISRISAHPFGIGLLLLMANMAVLFLACPQGGSDRAVTLGI